MEITCTVYDCVCALLAGEVEGKPGNGFNMSLFYRNSHAGLEKTIRCRLPVCRLVKRQILFVRQHDNMEPSGLGISGSVS